MAPKKGQPSPAAVPPSSVKSTHTSASAAPVKPAEKKAASSSSSSSSLNLRNAQDAQEILLGVWNNYVEKTPQRVKLLDAFMVFLMAVGVLQFVYCVVAGNYVSTQAIWAGCVSAVSTDSVAAVQRLPLRLLRDSRAVRAHGELADTDESGQQERLRVDIT